MASRTTDGGAALRNADVVAQERCRRFCVNRSVAVGELGRGKGCANRRGGGNCGTCYLHRRRRKCSDGGGSRAEFEQRELRGVPGCGGLRRLARVAETEKAAA